MEAAPTRQSAYAPLAGAALRVLIADDVKTNQLVLQAILTRARCEVSIVENGQAAIEACAIGSYHVVVMDLRMPGLNGIEATKAIRTAEQATSRARTPIVMCSADTEMGPQAAIAGADAYLIKPITPRALIEQIAAIVSA